MEFWIIELLEFWIDGLIEVQNSINPIIQ